MQTIIELTLDDSMFYGNIPIFTYHIIYPSLSTTRVLTAAQATNTCYVQLVETAGQYYHTVLYLQAVEGARYTPASYLPFDRCTSDMTYRVTYNFGYITSLYMDTYIYMGGAHREPKRTSNTWDFSSGRQLYLGDIPPLTPAALTGLQTAIEQQIVKRLKEPPGAYFEDYPYLLRNYFGQSQFFLRLGQIVIYYQ